MNRNRSELKSPIRIGGFVLLLAMLLIMLISSLFAAIMYDSSNSSAASIRQRMNYNTDYYNAETIATEILSGWADQTYAKTIESDTRIIYSTDKGDIEVIKAGGSTSFSVPINTEEELRVSAVVSGNDIDIVQWSVKRLQNN